MFERYAIFFTPPPGPLADFGAAWLGWDSAAGKAVSHLQVAGLDLDALTGTPRRYGFHATLKAPFRLNCGQSPDALIAAADAFAATRPPVRLAGLLPRYMHGFLALRPLGDESRLRSLAADITRHFDTFRAPATDAETDRRRKSRLTPRQDRQMLDWGYPYIFEDFNFHMTLSGRVDADAAHKILPALQSLAAPLIPGHFTIDAITVMGQNGAGYFHQLHRAELAGE